MNSPKRHMPPAGHRGQSQELLYDPKVPTPSHSENAKTLVDRMSVGTLSTIEDRPGGYPYGSFVIYAVHEGEPVFLVSALAEHTQNLERDTRASLMVAEAMETDNPLALSRVTLLGRCHKIDDAHRESVKAAFLERHPRAQFYVDFEDFSFWKLSVKRIRYIGGFGRMSWIESEAWVEAVADPIQRYAAGIIEHMNEDHVDTMVLYCQTMSKAHDTTEAELVSVDRYGFEMSAMTGEGPRPIRLAFSKPLEKPEEVRLEMVELAKRARSLASEKSES